MTVKAKRINKMPAIRPLTKRAAWSALKAHEKQLRSVHLRAMFQKDPKRGEKFTAEALGIYLDYSKPLLSMVSCCR